MSKARRNHIVPTVINTTYLYAKTPTLVGEGTRHERRARAKVKVVAPKIEE